ncbi:MMPL family transporter [Virgibacillus sp. MG-45]|uniref:MMPL family transporter n=1 Tax=Virgibacillus sp. MG-45 TaxID=3102791 RepID=UPI002ED7F06E
MLTFIRNIVAYTSSRKGAKVTLIAWIMAVLLFTVLAPSAKDYESNSTEGSIAGNTPSEIAQQLEKEQFPSKDGLTALLVFHKKETFSETDKEKFNQLSQWFASENKPENVAKALPYHKFPEHVQAQLFSEDKTTLLFNVTLKEGISTDETHDTLTRISDQVTGLGLDHMQFEITGPAGISADTITLFKNGDFVLMAATVVLIFILLILIYRSPLLAITPLIIAGLVYGVVDRILGMAGKFEWFAVDSSAVSIMLVLLFAVLTDYSLFVFSRYREKLSQIESKYDSMSQAMYHVAEPIFFSGGTIFLAMLTLFATIFEPYHAFAPVFSIAVVIILIAGITLIPSIFALMGRKAFWPFIPKVNNEQEKEHKFWGMIGQFVKKHPAFLAGSLLIVLLIGAFQVPTMNYSFNILKSFPDDMSSRQGFELLENHYPAGELAPVTIILKTEDSIDADSTFLQRVSKLVEKLAAENNVSKVSPDLEPAIIQGEKALPNNFLSEDGNAVKLELTLESNPYEPKALQTLEQLRDKEEALLEASGLSNHFELHYSGQTATQLDVRDMNTRDTIVLFSMVIAFITIVLGFQTRSFLYPILMVGSILLSYVATLGFSWWMFEHWLGYTSISYRLPVYTFVFMIALGIDYNIMLVSRIKEKANELPWNEAVAEGIRLTGGVISSAGLILAATFAVLMTQPLQELFLFGFTMAFGILLDTFIIRGMFFPSILLLTKPKSKQKNSIKHSK